MYEIQHLTIYIHLHAMAFKQGDGFNIRVDYPVNCFPCKTKRCSNFCLRASCWGLRIISQDDCTHGHFDCYWHSSFSNRLFVTVTGVDCSQDIDECEAMPCLNNGEITVCRLCI